MTRSTHRPTSFDWSERFPEALDTHYSAWSLLERRLAGARGPAHCADWNLAAHAAFAGNEEWRMAIGVQDGGEPVLGCVVRPAFRRVGGLNLPVIETPINPYLPLTDIAVVPGAAESILDFRRELMERRGWRWSALVVRRVPADGLLLSALQELSPACAVIRDDEPWFVLAARTRAENRDRLTKKFRANLRYATNKLATYSKVRFESVRCVDALPAAFGAFLDVEASGWKGRSASAVRTTPHALRFYTGLIERFGRRRECEINLLWANKTCIGAQLGLVIGGRTYLLKIGYNEEYAAAAPGHLMIEWLLDRCATESGRQDVCMTSHPHWLHSWRPERIGRSAVYILNRGPSGWAARLALRAQALRIASKGAHAAQEDTANVAKS